MKKLFVLSAFLLVVLFAHSQSREDAILSTMQPIVDSGDIAGMYYLIADSDKILLKGGIGYANIENKIKMDEDILFWIASQSKPIVGVAAMILADEGVLDLDKPVNEYLPELNHLMVRVLDHDSVEVLESIKYPVTLRKLLSHTSGMQFVGGVQQQFGKIDFLPLFKSIYVSNMTPLLFHPGEKYSYSNQGINTAAMIIERVSGMPYEEFIRKRIFEPLGMESITFWPTEKQMKAMAIPYKTCNGKTEPMAIGQLQYPLNDKNKRFAEAAGGLFCTPKDLVKFYQMIACHGVYNGKRILSEGSVKALGEKQTGDKVDSQYGLGWGVGTNYMGHGGAMGTQSRLFKHENLIVMYFSLGESIKEEKAYNTFETTVKRIFDIQ